MAKVGGYAGKILRVDLSNERVTEEDWDEASLRRYLGGTGIGAKVLYEEVPPNVAWNNPENRLIINSGPLGGTRVGGSGTISIITKGPLTNGATSTQANGYMGAFMKFSGYDGIIIQGAASRWLWLHLHDGKAELKDAGQLLGKDTWETDETLHKELGKEERELSVFSIGPAGENLVKFASIAGDKGHVGGHNGVGAVMGSKKLKAIAAERGRARIAVKDSQRLQALAREMMENVKNAGGIDIYHWGTSRLYSNAATGGFLPTKNYTTNIFPAHPQFMGDVVRKKFEIKRAPCWACQTHHCHIMKVTEGPYKGYVGEEPEYEGWATGGSVIGNTDPGGAVMISNEIDKLGLEVNESGWTVAWVMECYEKGLLTKQDTDGLEMTWGNTEAARALLHKIARREGFGDVLAEGVMRAAQRVGGEAANFAIYTKKGNSPRGHDHRARWFEMFDTAVSNTGTIESQAIFPGSVELGVPPQTDGFNPDEVATLVARGKGVMQFEDSIGTCRFTTRTDMLLLPKMLEAATGWDYTTQEAYDQGRRAVNTLRAYNIRCGIGVESEAPSPRYGSIPVDGPAAGKSIAPHWNNMLKLYYRLLGWDEATGKPTPETLRSLGLEAMIRDMWS